MTDQAIEGAIQNHTEQFKPTNGMLRWFDSALELGYGASITDVAIKSELQRSNWYEWIDKPGFVEWWDSQWQKYFVINRWKLKAIGMKQAERNYDYWHDMMLSSGQLQEKGNTTAIQFNFNGGKYIKDK